jgi:hypothetical protein
VYRHYILYHDSTHSGHTPTPEIVELFRSIFVCVLVGGQSCPIENMVDENFDRRKKRNFVLFKYIYRDRDRDLI